jgi:hypothetical protein
LTIYGKVLTIHFGSITPTLTARAVVVKASA